MAPLDTQLASLSAVLLDDRILRRVIKRHRRLHGIGLQVPHATSYTLPRAELVRLTDKDELPVDPATLPHQVVLFTGSRGDLADGKQEAWTDAWRAIFHARVHAAFDARLASGALTTAAIRERINRVGQTEFDEIRFVLRQEDLLLPPADDATTYVEFAALYLELAAFDPVTLARTFPDLADPKAVEATIALDVDAAALLAAARPPLAPEVPPVIASDEAAEAAPRRASSGRASFREPVVDPGARDRANATREKGNRARAAILGLRAGDDDAARRDLDELAERLSRALHGADATGWAAALLPVAQRAALQRVLRFEPGARLLHDLQTACVVAEREERVVDVVGWALVAAASAPVVRALPSAREVRVAKHLHAAANKIGECDLATGDERERARRRSSTTWSSAPTRTCAPCCARRSKARSTAVDLVAASACPRRSRRRSSSTSCSIRRWRSAGSRSGTCATPCRTTTSRWSTSTATSSRDGDQLLRADRALAQSLDGVYQRGEVYLRWLQKLSSIFFGTPVGRLASKFVLLPVLGAYAAIEGAQHMVGAFCKFVLDTEEPELATPASFATLAVFLFLLMHVPPFRRGVVPRAALPRRIAAAAGARTASARDRVAHCRSCSACSRAPSRDGSSARRSSPRSPTRSCRGTLGIVDRRHRRVRAHRRVHDQLAARPAHRGGRHRLDRDALGPPAVPPASCPNIVPARHRRVRRS